MEWYNQLQPGQKYYCPEEEEVLEFIRKTSWNSWYVKRGHLKANAVVRMNGDTVYIKWNMTKPSEKLFYWQNLKMM
jgi:hypothetical protein